MVDKHLIIIALIIILISLIIGCVAYFSGEETYVAVDLLEINQGDNLTISLTDSKGQPLANKTVHVTVNTVTYNLTTDGSGRTQLPIGLNPGEYNVYVKFDGEFAKYKSSEITQPLKVIVPVKTTSNSQSSTSYSSSSNSEPYIVNECYIDGTYYVETSDGWVYYYDEVTGCYGGFC